MSPTRRAWAYSFATASGHPDPAELPFAHLEHALEAGLAAAVVHLQGALAALAAPARAGVGQASQGSLKADLAKLIKRKLLEVPELVMLSRRGSVGAERFRALWLG